MIMKREVKIKVKNKMYQCDSEASENNKNDNE